MPPEPTPLEELTLDDVTPGADRRPSRSPTRDPTPRSRPGRCRHDWAGSGTAAAVDRVPEPPDADPVDPDRRPGRLPGLPGGHRRSRGRGRPVDPQLGGLRPHPLGRGLVPARRRTPAIRATCPWPTGTWWPTRSPSSRCSPCWCGPARPTGLDAGAVALVLSGLTGTHRGVGRRSAGPAAGRRLGRRAGRPCCSPCSRGRSPSASPTPRASWSPAWPSACSPSSTGGGGWPGCSGRWPRPPRRWRWPSW